MQAFQVPAREVTNVLILKWKVNNRSLQIRKVKFRIIFNKIKDGVSTYNWLYIGFHLTNETNCPYLHFGTFFSYSFESVISFALLTDDLI